MVSPSPKVRVQKVVCYVVHLGHLLVFTHDTVPIEVAGIQVPAGTIELGESPESAAVREVLEETGLKTRVVRFLGRELYDITPSRREVANRHFFELTPEETADVSARWPAGDSRPSSGDEWIPAWTCWWLPIEQAHVLAAGFGARIGALFD